MRQQEQPEWFPKTHLGKQVLAGAFASIDDLLQTGGVILEPQIVDTLIPDIKQDVVYIGGSPGKGGGIRRTATRRTVRMHKSGRRYKLSAVVVVGNENGIVGMGSASSREHRVALDKATQQAKLNVIRVRRGCGSWECRCDVGHSIPFATSAKLGSITVTLLPAPKGVGLVANDTVKKVLGLAGIKDIWVKTSGTTATRTNLVFAVLKALENMNRTRGAL
ncbi:MAG: 30S ribosomal protein S5 [Nanoarchaeota archaeon]|nr:30S ribosomal protein S5 [Nanoarchaeota archaeon]